MSWEFLDQLSIGGLPLGGGRKRSNSRTIRFEFGAWILYNG